MYLPALTDDEILSYAENYAESPLERELARRFAAFRDATPDEDDQIDSLASEGVRLEEELDESRGES